MSVLVVSEHRRGELRDVSHEAITAGRELADAQGGDLHVAVIGGDVDRFAEDLNREGVDAVHAVTNGEEFDHNVYQSAVGALLEKTGAETVVVPNSVNGLDYAPAVAEAHDLDLVTDAIGFEYDDGLTVTREMYGSKVETTVDVDGDRFLLTVRGGEWPPAEGVGDATIDGNAPSQPRETENHGFDDKSPEYVGLRFEHCDDLTIRGLTIERKTAWGIKCEAGDDFEASCPHRAVPPTPDVLARRGDSYLFLYTNGYQT
jgi:electron transfer flavoprotein alpha subunit